MGAYNPNNDLEIEIKKLKGQIELLKNDKEVLKYENVTIKKELDDMILKVDPGQKLDSKTNDLTEHEIKSEHFSDLKLKLAELTVENEELKRKLKEKYLSGPGIV